MKKQRILLLTVIATLLFTTPAYGYIDPSVTTYLIQAIAGIVIAVGAGVGLYFHKVKKKVNETLKIDENAKKEVEDDLVVFDDKEKK